MPKGRSLGPVFHPRQSTPMMPRCIRDAEGRALADTSWRQSSGRSRHSSARTRFTSSSHPWYLGQGCCDSAQLYFWVLKVIWPPQDPAAQLDPCSYPHPHGNENAFHLRQETRQLSHMLLVCLVHLFGWERWN